MTLDEAIKHAEEVAKEQEELYGICPGSESEYLNEIYCDGTEDCKVLINGKDKGCLKCAEEHCQLAEWLKELKQLKEQEPCEKFDRKDVIDALKICDCNHECVGCEECPIKDKNYNGSWSDDNGDCYIQLMHRAAELLSTQQEPCDVPDINVGDMISRQESEGKIK